MSKLPAITKRDAWFSSCRAYRYLLYREWTVGRRAMSFIMLNPSTADDEVDDPTIKRCIGIVQSYGCGSIWVANLFALRATDPRELEKHPDPVGPCNDATLLDLIKVHGRNAHSIIAAWGVRGALRGRDKAVLKLLGSKRLQCVGKTKDGYPRHPLYVRSAPPLDAFNYKLRGDV